MGWGRSPSHIVHNVFVHCSFTFTHCAHYAFSCTANTAHYTVVCTIQQTVDSARWTVCTVDSVNSAKWTLDSAQWLVCTVDSARWLVQSGQCAVHSGQCAVDSAQRRESLISGGSRSVNYSPQLDAE